MLRKIVQLSNLTRRSNVLGSLRFSSTTGTEKPPIIDSDEPIQLPLPVYPKKVNEPLQQQKMRLIYQSRKRGMLENDLLLSTFVDEYLDTMSKEHIDMYDDLINGVTNDWDIYYWVTEKKPTPPEYDNEIMRLLKTHVRNDNNKSRIRQPNLKL